MKNERILTLMGEIDEKYVEEAETAGRGHGKRVWLSLGVSAACVAVAVAAVLAIPGPSGITPAAPDESSISGGDVPDGIDRPREDTFDPIDVEYSDFSLDWQYYSDTRSLVEKSNCAVLGTVTDISFQLLDSRTASPVTEETDGFYIDLCTIYEVAVIKQYEGDATNGTIQVRVPGGIKGKYLEEQWNVLSGDARVENSIPCMEGIPEINIGETYLFLLWQYMDTAPTILNPTQSVYRVDSFSGESEPLREIISCFGESEWSEFQEIIHSFE